MVGDGVVSWDSKGCTCNAEDGGVLCDIIGGNGVVSCESKGCTCDDVACDVMGGDGVIDGVLSCDIV